MDEDRYYVGTDLKFLITLEAPGFSMDTDDYDIVLRCNGRTVNVEKSDIAVDDDSNHYLLVDTSLFENGTLQMVVYAHVPDSAFPDGTRTEVCVVNLCELKKVLWGV